MENKNKKRYDYSDFLMDDEFILNIGREGDRAEYLKKLKEKYTDQSDNIDLALKIFSELKRMSYYSSHEQRKLIWRRIIAQKAKERRFFVLRIAASFLILFGIGGALFYYFAQNKPPDIENFAKSIQHSFEQSKLILSDGKSLDLAENESNIKYSSNGSRVAINDSIQLVQEVRVENFNQLIVPFGRYNSLLLSDGTKVWVNSGSQLVYPPVFSDRKREVFVQGEAYFEVTKDNQRPFYVKTDRFQVKVLGTRFCVRASQEDDLFTTLLLEGEVTLTTAGEKGSRSSETRLNPGHMASLGKDDKEFSVMPVEYPENYIAWKNGYLIFNEEPLNKVCQRVARFYNISIESGKSLQDLKISGKLDLKDDPERVLKGISSIAKSKLTKEQDRFVIY